VKGTVVLNKFKGQKLMANWWLQLNLSNSRKASNCVTKPIFDVQFSGDHKNKTKFDEADLTQSKWHNGI